MVKPDVILKAFVISFIAGIEAIQPTDVQLFRIFPDEQILLEPSSSVSVNLTDPPFIYLNVTANVTGVKMEFMLFNIYDDEEAGLHISSELHDQYWSAYNLTFLTNVPETNLELKIFQKDGETLDSIVDFGIDICVPDGSFPVWISYSPDFNGLYTDITNEEQVMLPLGKSEKQTVYFKCTSSRRDTRFELYDPRNKLFGPLDIRKNMRTEKSQYFEVTYDTRIDYGTIWFPCQLYYFYDISGKLVLSTTLAYGTFPASRMSVVYKDYLMKRMANGSFFELYDMQRDSSKKIASIVCGSRLTDTYLNLIVTFATLENETESSLKILESWMNNGTRGFRLSYRETTFDAMAMVSCVEYTKNPVDGGTELNRLDAFGIMKKSTPTFDVYQMIPNSQERKIVTGDEIYVNPTKENYLIFSCRTNFKQRQISMKQSFDDSINGNVNMTIVKRDAWTSWNVSTVDFKVTPVSISSYMEAHLVCIMYADDQEKVVLKSVSMKVFYSNSAAAVEGGSMVFLIVAIVAFYPD